jgi:hypothetical protein
MALFLLAALLGLFGSGLLNQVTASTPDGVGQLDDERLTRYVAPTSLRLTVAPAAASEGVVDLWLNHAYLQAVQLEQVVPEPLESSDEADVLSARQFQGLERLEQIQYALLERAGPISVIPNQHV